MTPGYKSLKNRRPAARLATLYADQSFLPNEDYDFKIPSINQVDEGPVIPYHLFGQA